MIVSVFFKTFEKSHNNVSTRWVPIKLQVPQPTTSTSIKSILTCCCFIWNRDNVFLTVFGMIRDYLFGMLRTWFIFIPNQVHPLCCNGRTSLGKTFYCFVKFPTDLFPPLMECENHVHLITMLLIIWLSSSLVCSLHESKVDLFVLDIACACQLGVWSVNPSLTMVVIVKELSELASFPSVREEMPRRNSWGSRSGEIIVIYSGYSDAISRNSWKPTVVLPLAAF